MHLNEIIMAGLAGSVLVSGVLVEMLGSVKSYTVLQVFSAVSLLAFSVAYIGLMNNSVSVLKQQVFFWAAVAAACVVAVGFLNRLHWVFSLLPTEKISVIDRGLSSDRTGFHCNHAEWVGLKCHIRCCQDVGKGLG